MEEAFKQRLSILADDEVAVRAIEWVISEKIKEERPVIGESKDNNLLGEQYRAYTTSKIILNNSIKEILSYRKNRKDNNNFNKAI
jgi:hypothetical protein